MIDAKDGTVLGTIDLGGVPEQGVGDGKGMLYVVMQDAQGSVTAVDVKTMKAVAHYPLGERAVQWAGVGCEEPGALRGVRDSGNPPAQPAQPMMVILSAEDGKILSEPAARGWLGRRGVQPGDDGSFQHARERNTDRRQGEEPDEFRGRAESADDEWRPDDRIRQQNEPHLHDEPERGPAPPPPPGGGRGPQGAPVPGSFTILMIGK